MFQFCSLASTNKTMVVGLESAILKGPLGATTHRDVAWMLDMPTMNKYLIGHIIGDPLNQPAKCFSF